MKSIVIACNTATAHALSVLRDELDMPVIGVVEPGARAAVAATTRRTHRRHRHRRHDQIGRVRARDSRAQSGRHRSRRAPVRSSFRSSKKAGPITRPRDSIAREYLEPLVAADIDTLVLGCTHYPLLKPLLREVLGPDVRLIDSAEETAAETARTLAGAQLAARRRRQSRHIASSRPTIRCSSCS